MSVTTYEGIVENGLIRLAGEVQLPEHAKVYVIVPSSQESSIAHIYSPHLADARDADKFTMEVVEESSDASI